MMNIPRLDCANAKILENFTSTKSREKQIKHISPYPLQPHSNTICSTVIKHNNMQVRSSVESM